MYLIRKTWSPNIWSQIYDFFREEVRQPQIVSDEATTPNEELQTEETPVQPMYLDSDDSCTGLSVFKMKLTR